MHTLAKCWLHFWFAPSAPTNLCVSRFVVCGAFFLWYLPIDFSLWGRIDGFWMPIPLFRHGRLPPASVSVLATLQVLWKTALALSCLGVWTRWSTTAAFFFSVYLLGLPHNFGKTHHHDAVVVIVLAILALSRCGDAWSVDAWWRKRQLPLGARQPIPPSGEYTWPIQAVWMLFALVFFAAGVAKLRRSGLDWIFSDNLSVLLIRHQYEISSSQPLVTWGPQLAPFSWLCQSLAFLTVFGELAFPLTLVSRWARWLLVPFIISLQISIRVLLGPSFMEFLICYLFWVPWDRFVKHE